jgi:hypothetical protein
MSITVSLKLEWANCSVATRNMPLSTERLSGFGLSAAAPGRLSDARTITKANRTTLVRKYFGLATLGCDLQLLGRAIAVYLGGMSTLV